MSIVFRNYEAGDEIYSGSHATMSSGFQYKTKDDSNAGDKDYQTSIQTKNEDDCQGLY